MKVIVLAGGYDQIALIEEFRRKNYETILVDYYKNPPARKYADRHYQISTLDIEAVKKIAIKEKADLITTACTDQALLSVAQISRELDLPCYISYYQALNVTNKMYMKREMSKAGIPTAKHIVVSDINEVDLSSLEFPIVVKPSDCNSSKGVKKIISPQEDNYLTIIEDAIKLSRTKTAIIEEYIEGYEISIDAFVSEGKAKVLLITKSEKIKNTNGFTITQSKYPVNISSKLKKRIDSIVQSISKKFHIINGPLLVQMIISNDNPYVIEFSARMGGGTKYKLIEVLTGFNVMKAYVELVTNEKPLVSLKKQFNYAHLNYCYATDGVFSKLYGFEELKRKGIIYDYFKYKTEGSVINKAETSSDRIAGYLITANTFEELVRKEQIANHSIKILSDTGEDIMRHDLLF